MVLLLQAGKLLLEEELLALGAQLLDFTGEHVVFVDFGIKHQRDFVSLKSDETGLSKKV